jgi:hypothetical protein
VRHASAGLPLDELRLEDGEYVFGLEPMREVGIDLLRQGPLQRL